MINKLVFENLRDRWVRTFLSALVIGVQVMSYLTLVGLSKGMLQESANRQKGTGADIFMKQDTGGSFSLSSGQLPQAFVTKVAQQPHVAQAIGVLSYPVEVITTIQGVNIPEFEKMTGGIRMVGGKLPSAADDLLIDQYYAQQNKLKVGQKWKLINHDWTISGIMYGGVLGRLIVPLTTLQDLTSNSNRVSQILVKLDNPALTNQEVNTLNDVFKGYLRALSTEAFVSQFSINNFPQLKAFIAVITGLAVLVGFLVVFLSMYTAVVERTREIGILKALGAKPRTILDILVREAIVLSVVGWIIGLALAFGAKGLITVLRPASLQVVNVPERWPIAAAIALCGALLGAIYPGLKAARQDAIEALAYE